MQKIKNLNQILLGLLAINGNTAHMAINNGTKAEFEKKIYLQTDFLFKTDLIKVALVFLICNFFINKDSQGRKSVCGKST